MVRNRNCVLSSSRLQHSQNNDEEKKTLEDTAWILSRPSPPVLQSHSPSRRSRFSSGTARHVSQRVSHENCSRTIAQQQRASRLRREEQRHHHHPLAAS